MHLDLIFFSLLEFQRGFGSLVMSFSILVIFQHKVILAIGSITYGCHGSED